MILVSVLIERKTNTLDKPFVYLYSLPKKIDVGVRVIVPFNQKDLVGYVINIHKDKRSKKKYENDSGFILRKIKKVIDEVPILNSELFSLAKKISDYYLVPLISVLQIMLPQSLKPNLSSLRAPKIHYIKYLKVMNNESFMIQKLTSKQLAMFNLIKKSNMVQKKEIKNLAIIKKLIELNLVKEVEIENYRYQIANYFKLKKCVSKLTNDQIKAINNILNSDKKVILLDGITGSGKTEIYFHLSQEIVKKKQTVLILVPEISLIGNMIEHCMHFFTKERIAILHSELTLAEKYDEYRRINQNKVDIVIGARSAIFAPLKNIGLIILDEEHAETYKQDSIPPYHARKVAFMRAKEHNALVILGSATPSLETYIRAIKGIYQHVKLTKRINNLSLPQTHIIDVSKAQNLLNNTYIFSTFLYQKIKERLDKKEQIVLLINRRGFSTSVICRNCETILKCFNCDIPLTYHKDIDSLKCHYCDHTEKMFQNCLKCNTNSFIKIGFGIEKVEQELKNLFPKIRILRLDSDKNKTRNNVFKTIEKFHNGEADVLIGTQMIAKGHNFANVTLVGVVLADIGLTFPSFQSTERVFSLLTQVIGRSGRNKKNGEAIIQTYLPNHYVINLASKQDYVSFFNHEMKVRKISQYPPFVHLISLIIKSKKETLLEDISNHIVIDLMAKKIEDVKVVGPSKPYVSFEKKWYIRKVLIKYKKNISVLREYISNLLKSFNQPNVKILINVDPFDF